MDLNRSKAMKNVIILDFINKRTIKIALNERLLLVS